VNSDHTATLNEALPRKGTIAILTDLEVAHTMAFFWVSRHLAASGYRVCFLALPHVEKLVRSQGFECITILGDIISKASRQNGQGMENHRIRVDRDLYYEPLARGEVLDRAIAELNPDVIFILSFYYPEALVIRYRYRLPIVFLTPNLRLVSRAPDCEYLLSKLSDNDPGIPELTKMLREAGVQFTSLKELAPQLMRWPELALLPKAFDLPERKEEEGVFYIGAGTDLSRSEEPFCWDGIDSDRPLIYCALGSQVRLQQESCRRTFQIVIDGAGARPDWQFILAISRDFDSSDFSNVPPNVRLLNWAPQLQILSRSSVMINHGGFDTVKECILMGVPMIALPRMNYRDHATCAERVVYHGLGARADMANVTSNELMLLIEQIINAPSYKRQVELMRERFKQQERLDLIVKVFDGVISNSEFTFNLLKEEKANG
jgi:MGT family glycosyltransferase